MTRGSNPSRRILATGAAVCAHLLALLALGWRTPRLAEPAAGPEPPPVQVTILRLPRSVQAPAAGSAAPAILARPRPPAAAASAAIAPAPAIPAQPAPGSALAEGPPDCEPEDLSLLTQAERARCRNQTDAERGRRLARGADARIAKEVARANSAPRIDPIPSEKRAYYDAVAAAYDQQSHGPPMAGRYVGIGCSVKFSGLKIVKSKPPPNSLSLGPCFVSPPQGFLTEESAIAPP